ncbi:MAG: hypothetical protein MUF21_14115 [Gemmatimonadaceae bacterium]|nr:hypothetical protein [Gemmatimonadaceae bacterium]
MTWPVDTQAWIGPYPFRELPHPEPDALVRVLERERIGAAWVGAMAAPWHRDPSPSNAWLRAQLARHAEVLHAVPCVRPDWPGWERILDEAVARGEPAVCTYPMQQGIAATGDTLPALARACAVRGLVVRLTVRFEDLRQRHALDTAGDLTAAHVRALVRADPRVHVVVGAASAELIAETHWSLTPGEQVRCWWDWAWLWGPPEDRFAALVRSIGADRFVFGGHWPLRLVQAPVAVAELASTDLPAATYTSGAAIVAAARSAAVQGAVRSGPPVMPAGGAP